MIVSMPKSLLPATRLLLKVATVYEAAQDWAPTEIIGWLGQHGTSRSAPLDAQVSVPVGRLEAVTVWHNTWRAGDPSRHLHLQINRSVERAP